MRTLRRERGGGVLQDMRKGFLQYISGRKKLQKKYMRTAKLSKAEKEDQEKLLKQWIKTKNEKEKLNRLQAKVSTLSDYQRIKAEQGELRNRAPVTEVPVTEAPAINAPTKKSELDKRWAVQKYFNRFYPDDTETIYPVKFYPFYEENHRREAEINPEMIQEVKTLLDIYKAPQEVTVNDSIRKVVYGNAINLLPETQRKVESHPYESLLSGKRRTYAYLYDTWKGVNTDTEEYRKKAKYASLEQLRDILYAFKSYILVNARELYENSASVGVDEATMNQQLEKLSQTLFDRSYETINKGIQAAEKANYLLWSPEDPSKLEIANAYGGYLERYIRGTQSVRDLVYQNEYSKYVMPAGSIDIERPILPSFDYPLNICLFGDFDHYKRTDRLEDCSHFIITNPMYISGGKKSFEKSQAAQFINAQYFRKISFIRDAFHEQAVDLMDEDLFTLIQKTEPELIESSKVTLATPAYFKSLNLRQVYMQNYMIFNEGVLSHSSITTYRNPLLLPDVITAMLQPNLLLFCDPFTAFCTKKKSPDLWKSAFGDAALPLEYELLTETEKFFVDFYQYVQIVQTKFLANTSGTDARYLNASQVYSQRLDDPTFFKVIRSYSKGEELKIFLVLQEKINTYDVPLQTEGDIETLLRKLRNKIPFYKAAAENQKKIDRKKTVKKRFEPRLAANNAAPVVTNAPVVATNTRKTNRNTIMLPALRRQEEALIEKKRVRNELEAKIQGLQAENASLAKGSWIPWKRKTMKQRRTELQRNLQGLQGEFLKKNLLYREAKESAEGLAQTLATSA